ncbi:ribonuclease III [Waterburya agarophytonicola K14]|uniref:Ribonuclease 3 n=1 Tax=Waterburya agarophytonicola KI4 TaxID=2874699 RepID=A0A964FJ68_9CYAN|nr:ribonuclease III [Waterburya agarophytonicola]MCC0178949.1 ribonuclease III [Waterburya agarophytonicola KI4]
MIQKLPSFKNPALFELALTHRSYANENTSIASDNERLEFLGDAVLGFVIAEMLYTIYPSINEAQLTHLRSRLVDEKQLGRLGKELGLGALMRLGKGAAKDGGRDNPSLLNDTFEATLGAYFLDAGIESVRQYILEIFQPLAEALVNDSLGFDSNDGQKIAQPQATFIDSKNRFQQWALANHQAKPEYEIIAESGCDRNKQFTARVSVLGKVYGIGTDRRKKEAEKRAAEAAMAKIAPNTT